MLTAGRIFPRDPPGADVPAEGIADVAVTPWALSFRAPLKLHTIEQARNSCLYE
jgi:hypothetical protein